MNVEKWIFIGCVTWKNCGASSAQEGALQSDQAFQKMMTSNYSTDFGQNEGLFNNLSNNLGTIVNAGAGQQGFSPEESAAMNSQAVNDAAAANQKAQVAIGNTAAAHGAANPGVESGITQAERSSAATAANAQENNQLANITQQNYATGRQNYWNAVGEQAKLPSELETPSTQAAGAVTNANSATSDQANQNAAANNAWMGMVSGLAGDAASAYGSYKK